MDESAGRAGGSEANPGVVCELARTSGAIANMAVLAPGAELPAHTHEVAYLSLCLLGSYREEGEAEAVSIDGPAAAFHPAGATHSDRIGPRGLTTVVIAFEPAWLKRALGDAPAPRGSVYWKGGAIAARAAVLARTCLDAGDAHAGVSAAGAFVAAALRQPQAQAEPPWIGRLQELLAGEDRLATQALARRLGLSPSWLSRAYRAVRGEGLAEAVRRARAEQAVRLLEDGDMPLAEVAAACGFCDQSHMNRVFRTILRRTPAEVRLERRGAAGGVSVDPRVRAA